MQIALNLIAVLAFIMSAATWIVTIVKQRKNIHITALTYDAGHKKGNKNNPEIRFFYVIIENRSNLSISITDVAVLYKGDIFHCKLLPVEMATIEKKEPYCLPERKILESFQFPINIASLSAASGYLYFEFPQHTLPADATQVTFQVSTTRGGLKVCVPLQGTTSFKEIV